MIRSCSILGCCAGLAAATLWAAAPAPEATRIRSAVKADPHTGKLVRSVIATPKSELSGTEAGTARPAALDAAVQEIAAQHSLPPELLHSVIQVESNYNPYAVSPKGAKGLMQLIPETARRFGVTDVFDAVENIQGGAKYLQYLLELYKGDYPRALAAYNAGEKAVEKYNGVPPYQETQNYVVRVQKKLASARAAAKASAAQVTPAEKPAEPVDAPRHLQEVVDADGAVRYVSR